MSHWSRWYLHAIVALTLSMGIAIYFYARPESIFFAGKLYAMPLTGQLPSFLHTVAFALACSLMAGQRQTARVAVIAWGTVELLAEFAQHDRFPVVSLLQRYQQASTFDVGDLLAILLATLIAVRLTSSSKKTQEQQ